MGILDSLNFRSIVVITIITAMSVYVAASTFTMSSGNSTGLQDEPQDGYRTIPAMPDSVNATEAMNYAKSYEEDLKYNQLIAKEGLKNIYVACRSSIQEIASSEKDIFVDCIYSYEQDVDRTDGIVGMFHGVPYTVRYHLSGDQLSREGKVETGPNPDEPVSSR